MNQAISQTLVSKGLKTYTGFWVHTIVKHLKKYHTSIRISIEKNKTEHGLEE